MQNDEQFDFQKEMADILAIPGVSKKKIAEWAGVDPSSVTRWHQGAEPSDPVGILKRIMPHVEQARAAVASVQRTEVESWRSLYGELPPGVREYVDKTGLLAGVYTVIASWIPSSKRANECDVVILRYFENVWADMSRRIYNVGDQAQIVVLSTAADAPRFDQETPVGRIVKVKIAVDQEVGRSVARLHIQLNLEDFPYRNDSIGFIDGFGYRFRATRAIVSKRLYEKQTNDFLGAPSPIPCRRLNLIACVPRSCVRGSPCALSSSNRSMMKVLMELDNAEPDMLESMLWPRGQRYDMSSAPDAPLKAVPRISSMIENLPHSLRQALNQPADATGTDETIQDVLCSAESACFLLDLYAPHPSLTHIIVWRLPHSEE